MVLSEFRISKIEKKSVMLVYDTFPVKNILTGDLVCSFSSLDEAKSFCADQHHRIAFEDMPQHIWHIREASRFENGEYRYLPVGFPPVVFTTQYHFAHIALDGKRISYTANHEHGVLDRQTVIRPGRYLKKYYSAFFRTNTSLIWQIPSRRLKQILFYYNSDQLARTFGVPIEEVATEYPTIRFPACLVGSRISRVTQQRFTLREIWQ
jgi:hypothetical protein